MQILLANAKMMWPQSKVKRKPTSTPLFQSVANQLAAEMAQMDIDELARQLDCSRKLAAENWKRYQEFPCAETMPAILAYNGQAYKHLKANTLSSDAIEFAQNHLWITCFLYGLLRPMDAIVPYRMERPSPSPSRKGRGVDTFVQETRQNIYQLCEERKAQLTDVLIDSVKADDGILVHLSTEEYEHLFDWKRVIEEVKVIHPLFYVRKPDGNLRMQAVWAKSCRGAMVRYILKNGITSPEELNVFSYEGFEYSPNHGEEAYPHFIRN